MTPRPDTQASTPSHDTSKKTISIDTFMIHVHGVDTTMESGVICCSWHIKKVILHGR